MDEIMQAITAMRKQCGWDKSDNVANMIKSVSVEAGELLETIQWDDGSYDAQQVSDELADVLMYALTLCQLLGRTPYEIITHKIEDVQIGRAHV